MALASEAESWLLCILRAAWGGSGPWDGHSGQGLAEPREHLHPSGRVAPPWVPCSAPRKVTIAQGSFGGWIPSGKSRGAKSCAEGEGSRCPQGTCVFCIVCGTCACDAWSYSGNVCVWLCHHSCSPHGRQRHSRLLISLNSAAQHGLRPKTAVGWPRSRGYGSRRPGESVLFGTIRCAGEVGRCPAWVQPWAVMAGLRPGRGPGCQDRSHGGAGGGGVGEIGPQWLDA